MKWTLCLLLLCGCGRHTEPVIPLWTTESTQASITNYGTTNGELIAYVPEETNTNHAITGTNYADEVFTNPVRVAQEETNWIATITNGEPNQVMFFNSTGYMNLTVSQLSREIGNWGLSNLVIIARGKPNIGCSNGGYWFITFPNAH